MLDTLQNAEFGSVIRLHNDGTTTVEGHTEQSITVSLFPAATLTEGEVLTALREELGELAVNIQLVGLSNQGGHIMHPSEFISEGMAESFRESPGFYLVLAVDVEEACDTCDQEHCPGNSGDVESAGWIIVHWPVIA